MRVGRPLPNPQNSSRNDGKGAAVSRTAHPKVCSCDLCIHNSVLSKQRPTRPTENKKTEPKGKGRQRPGETRPRTTIPRSTTTTTKKQAREPDLAKGAEQEVRIVIVVRGRDEETQREPQTPERGFGFPQRVRERKKKREQRRRNQTNNQRTRKKGQQTSGQTGVRSLRATIQTPCQPQTQKNQITYPTSNPENRTKTRYKTSKVSEDLSPQGGGALGPP